MPRLPIYHALSHQRASTDHRLAKGSTEKGQCRFRRAVMKQRRLWSFRTSMPGIQSLSLHQVLLLITSFPYLRRCSTRTESPKRSNRIMGPRLMDQSLRTLLRNKGSDTERSPLGGLKLMVTWSVSCKPSRRVREFLNLKEKLFGRECKERLAAIAPRPTQRQRKALTCSCSAESYGGSYRKGSYPQEKFHTTQSDKETRLKRSR